MTPQSFSHCLDKFTTPPEKIDDNQIRSVIYRLKSQFPNTLYDDEASIIRCLKILKLNKFYIHAEQILSALQAGVPRVTNRLTRNDVGHAKLLYASMYPLLSDKNKSRSHNHQEVARALLRKHVNLREPRYQSQRNTSSDKVKAIEDIISSVSSD